MANFSFITCLLTMMIISSNINADVTELLKIIKDEYREPNIDCKYKY
jgi:hypothetical protein